MPRLPKYTSIKERLWIDAFLFGEDPGNRTQAAKDAKYKCSSESAFGVIGYKNFKKFERYIAKWLDEMDLSEGALKRKLVEGLDATKSRFIIEKGKVIKTIQEADWPSRQRFLDMAFKAKSLYPLDKTNVIHTFDPEQLKLLKAIFDEFPADIQAEIWSRLNQRVTEEFSNTRDGGSSSVH